MITDDAQIGRPRSVLEPATHSRLHDVSVNPDVDETRGRSNHQALHRLGHDQP
jgi:hypothetical protein